MSIYEPLTENDYDHLHDVIYEAYGYKPSDDDIVEYWESLPYCIKEIAYEWGCNDTIFRDEMYHFLINRNR